MADAKRSQGDREMLRFLRLLAHSAKPVGQSTRDSAVELHHGGKVHVISAETVRQANHNGLTKAAPEGFAITGEGRAALVRLLHPEDEYCLQHVEIRETSVETPSGRAALRFNDAESPLTRLHARKSPDGVPFLSPEQFAAGERLRCDFEKARLQPRISARWERPVASSTRNGIQAELSDFAIDARRRIDKAMLELAPDLRGVALDVCCFLKGLEQVERERRLPPRSGKLLLRAALSVLGAHYGMIGRGRQGGTILQWGTCDYRPAIESVA